MNTKKGKSRTTKLLEKIAGGPLTLGALLHAIRLGEECSLEKFSSKLGITLSHLCDIEKGRKTVSPERAAKFAKTLGRSKEQFVRLALQGIVNHSGLKMKVWVEAA